MSASENHIISGNHNKYSIKLAHFKRIAVNHALISKARNVFRLKNDVICKTKKWIYMQVKYFTTYCVNMLSYSLDIILLSLRRLNLLLITEWYANLVSEEKHKIMMCCTQKFFD